MTRPWMIDELAHAGPEHLDPGFVAGFDRKQGYPDPTEDLAALREHGIGPAATVVDLGAGTGRFTLAVAPQVARVVAVDVSPAMLARAAQRLPSGVLVEGDATALPYRTGSVAAAVAVLFFHLVADRAHVFEEIARVLAPGGLLVVTPVQPEKPADPIGAWDWDHGAEVRNGDPSLTGEAAAVDLRYDRVVAGPRLEATFSPIEEAERRERLWKLPAGSLSALRELPDADVPVHRDLTQWALVLRR